MTPAALELALPGALWGLLLLVPLALFHLYHRRRITVAFLPLLVEAVGPRRPGGGWRTLRDVLALVLRAAALVALLLAIAGLAPARAGPPPEALYLVVDADLSARTIERDGRTRYAHALDLAAASLAEAPWAEVSVLEARDAPSVVVPTTTDREGARVALRRLLAGAVEGRIEAAPAPTSLDAAVEAAMTEARQRPAARVRVLSARTFESERWAGTVPVEVWGTGEARDDAGIVGFEVVPDAEGVRVLVRLSLRSFAAAATERTLVVQVAEAEVLRRGVALPPGVPQDLEVEVLTPVGGAWLEARLEGADVFETNDRVTAWLSAPLRPSLLVVHDGALRPWTRAVVQALGDGIDVEHSGSVAAVDLPRAADRDVYLVDGAALPSGALRPGAWVFVAPLAGELPFAVGEVLERPLVWRSAPDHPLVRDLDLSTAWVARGYGVEAPELVPLAEADGRVVLGEGERGDVRYVVLGLDPARSDLPLRAALPLLLRNAIRRLATRPKAPLKPFYAAGASVRPGLDLPGGPEVRLHWAGGSREVRIARDGATYRAPVGGQGRVEVRPRRAGAGAGAGDAVWRTAFVALQPDLDLAPQRPEHARPPASRPPRDAPSRWRLALLTAAGLLLLLDLAVVGRLRRGERELASARFRR